jgi:uridine kinase
MADTLVLGIAGGTGSGKTTLMRALTQQFEGRIAVISHDNYYRAHDELTLQEREQLNYDHPDALETELLIDHILRLKAGQSIACPIYDYTLHNRSAETLEIAPKPVIVVEGILIFASETLCDLMDMKIFVDTDDDVRLARRIKRDVRKRGRSLESVITQYLTTVKPMHERFVQPSKKRADLVVLEGGKNQVAQKLLFGYIEDHLKKAGQA